MCRCRSLIWPRTPISDHCNTILRVCERSRPSWRCLPKSTRHINTRRSQTPSRKRRKEKLPTSSFKGGQWGSSHRLGMGPRLRSPSLHSTRGTTPQLVMTRQPTARYPYSATFPLSPQSSVLVELCLTSTLMSLFQTKAREKTQVGVALLTTLMVSTHWKIC